MEKAYSVKSVTFQDSNSEYTYLCIRQLFSCFHNLLNINEITKQNNNFRTALWTGEYLQITLMSINVGESIGLEMHPNLDQFIRIEQGYGLVQMGDDKNNLNFVRKVYDDFVIVIPAGKWHNLTNIGNLPIKLYSIYAPPQHPKGTIHRTKADAEH